MSLLFAFVFEEVDWTLGVSSWILVPCVGSSWCGILMNLFHFIISRKRTVSAMTAKVFWSLPWSSLLPITLVVEIFYGEQNNALRFCRLGSLTLSLISFSCHCTVGFFYQQWESYIVVAPFSFELTRHINENRGSICSNCAYNTFLVWICVKCNLSSK